jgi:hypothetical protein
MMARKLSSPRRLLSSKSSPARHPAASRTFTVSRLMI